MGDSPRTRSSVRLNNGHAAVVQLLIQHGADGHASDDWVWGALRIALQSGHADIARLLIQHSAALAKPDELKTCSRLWPPWRHFMPGP